MLDDFVIRAGIGGILLALMSGPLGCVLVWRRMAFFGETIAHGALLGAGLGLLLNINILYGVLASSILLSVLITLLSKRNGFTSDSILGVLSHSFLAFGLILIGFSDGGSGNLTGYLFGDILSISATDIVWIGLASLTTLAILATIWRQILLITLNEDLAIADCINVDRIKLIFMLLIALVIAIAMQYVGILLVMALLIIPAVTVHRFVHSAEQMVAGSIIVGISVVIGGIVASLQWDIATGPAIVAVSTLLFVLSAVTSIIRK